MDYQIIKSKLTDELKRKIYQGFRQHSLKAKGFDGLGEEAVSFEIHHGQEFVGAVVVQLFWRQFHIKYLFVDEKYRGRGLGRHLMLYALDFGRELGCDFAFVETMNFQAVDFYQKMGFVTELTRNGYANNSSLLYLRKSLSDVTPYRKVTRLGVYGIVQNEGKILLIVQQKGPYAGKYDLPGGGIEFGESPEETLRREFVEEVASEFSSCRLFDNIMAVVQVPRNGENEPYTFYHVGMFYQIDGLRPLSGGQPQELSSYWLDISLLKEEECSALLWKIRCQLH